MAYSCDEDDGNAAEYLVTYLPAGEVLALCAPHYGAYVQLMAQSLAVSPDSPIGQVPTDPDTGDESDEDDTADLAHGPATAQAVPDLPVPDLPVVKARKPKAPAHT